MKPHFSGKSIYYIDALPGIGKTWTIINRIVKLMKEGKRCVYAAPTVALLNETYKRVCELTSESKCQIVVTTTDKEFVYPKVANSVSRLKPGNALFITHSSLLNAPIVPEAAAKIDLFIDEALDLFFKEAVETNIRLSDVMHEVGISSHVISETAVHQVLLLKVKRNIQTKMKNFMPSLISLLNTSGKYTILALSHKRRNLILSLFLFHDHHRLSMWKKTVIASAFLTKTTAFHYLSLFYRLVDISSVLKEERLALLGKRYEQVNLHYLFNNEEKGRSKYLESRYIVSNMRIKLPDDFNLIYQSLKNKELKYELTVNDVLVSAVVYSLNATGDYKLRPIGGDSAINDFGNPIVKGFHCKNTGLRIAGIGSYSLMRSRQILKPTNSDPVLIVYNNIDYPGSAILQHRKLRAFGYYGNAELTPEDFYKKGDDNFNYMKVSSSSHGLNTYDKVNKMVFLSSLNYRPTLAKFYRILLPRFDTRTGLLFNGLCQTVNRLSVRNPSSRKDVNITVFSRRDALLLKDAFLGLANIVHHDFTGKHGLTLVSDLTNKKTTYLKPITNGDTDAQDKADKDAKRQINKDHYIDNADKLRNAQRQRYLKRKKKWVVKPAELCAAKKSQYKQALKNYRKWQAAAKENPSNPKVPAKLARYKTIVNDLVPGRLTSEDA